jgi:cell division protein FtsL
MTFSDIETIIIAYAPLVVTIIGIITSFIKMISVLKTEKRATNEQITELKEQLKAVVDQNYTLKTQLNELLTKIDNVRRQ